MHKWINSLFVLDLNKLTSDRERSFGLDVVESKYQLRVTGENLFEIVFEFQ